MSKYFTSEHKIFWQGSRSLTAFTYDSGLHQLIWHYLCFFYFRVGQ